MVIRRRTGPAFRLGLVLLIFGGPMSAPAALAQYDATVSQCLSTPPSSAASVCGRAFETNRGNARVAIALAEALKRSGQAERAVQVLEQARAAGAGGADLAHALRIARSYLEEQRFEAEQSAARADSGNAVQLRVERIKCETLSGRAALTACEAALALAPGDRELSARRSSLRAALGIGGGGSGGGATAAARPAPDPAPSAAPAPAAPVAALPPLPPPDPGHSALGPKPDPTAVAVIDPPLVGKDPVSPGIAPGLAEVPSVVLPPVVQPPAVDRTPEMLRPDAGTDDPIPPGPATPAPVAAPAAAPVAAPVASLPPPDDPPASEPRPDEAVDEASLGASRQLDTAPTPAPAPNPAPNADTPVLVLGGVGSGRPPEAADNGAIATRLATLRDLRARDLLTEAEYQERREAILRRAFGLGPGSGAGTGSAPAD